METDLWEPQVSELLPQDVNKATPLDANKARFFFPFLICFRRNVCPEMETEASYSTSKVGKCWHQLVSYIQKPHGKGLRI